jgi:hypothetical protein
LLQTAQCSRIRGLRLDRQQRADQLADRVARASTSPAWDEVLAPRHAARYAAPVPQAEAGQSNPRSLIDCSMSLSVQPS